MTDTTPTPAQIEADPRVQELKWALLITAEKLRLLMELSGLSDATIADGIKEATSALEALTKEPKP